VEGNTLCIARFTNKKKKIDFEEFTVSDKVSLVSGVKSANFTAILLKGGRL